MKIIIYGAGQQAAMTHYFFTHDSPHEVVAFCVDAAYLPGTGTHYMGLPVVAFEEVESHYAPGDYLLHIAIGPLRARQLAFESAKKLGYEFANYISSKASVWPDLQMGAHIFIDQGSIVLPFVTMGDNVQLGLTQVGHHTVIGSNILMSACTIGAGVTIGDGTFVGIGSIINSHIRVGRNNIIGLGSVINRHSGDNEVYSGQASKKRLMDASRINPFKR